MDVATRRRVRERARRCCQMVESKENREVTWSYVHRGTSYFTFRRVMCLTEIRIMSARYVYRSDQISTIRCRNS